MRWARVLPQTIFWRLTWLTAGALIISVSFVIALFAYQRQQMVAAAVTEQVSEVLADLEDQLDGMTPAEQAEWLAATRRPYTPYLIAIDNPEVRKAGPLLSAQSREIAATLQRKLAGVSEIREVRRPKRQLWVKVDMLGQPRWLVVPLGRFKMDASWTLAASAAMFALVALTVAALFAWRINRPLRELRQAAAQLGRGEQPAPLPETGPLEVKELSASFNRMLSDLDANERERGVMLAGISHDLRTPLARLKLGVEMMHDDSLQGGMQEDIEDIERILGQFIDFARGSGSESPVVSDPADLARNLVARYHRSGCAIELDLADELPLLALRPLALSRALSNLIDNACRYGSSPISLCVAYHNAQLCFSVRDHGPGIPPQQLALALQPFQRLDSARRADGGSGLGLAIVERIARQHGGQLKLCNHPDGGLLAELSLPACQQQI